MTVAELTKRVEELEREVARLKQERNGADDERPWWERKAGTFEDDPGFEEMVRLGREYRESLRPKPKRKRKVAKKS
jgi:hypothetical protein